MAKKTTKKLTKTRKRACGPTKHCSDYGRKLATEHTSPAGKGLSRVCKPEKKKRKQRGCLNGTPKGTGRGSGSHCVSTSLEPKLKKL